MLKAHRADYLHLAQGYQVSADLVCESLQAWRVGWGRPWFAFFVLLLSFSFLLLLSRAISFVNGLDFIEKGLKLFVSLEAILLVKVSLIQAQETILHNDGQDIFKVYPARDLLLINCTDQHTLVWNQYKLS